MPEEIGEEFDSAAAAKKYHTAKACPARIPNGNSNAWLDGSIHRSRARPGASAGENSTPRGDGHPLGSLPERLPSLGEVAASGVSPLQRPRCCRQSPLFVAGNSRWTLVVLVAAAVAVAAGEMQRLG